MKFFLKKIIIPTILFLYIFTTIFFSENTKASSDAIAIRVIPNPNNYSVKRWYKENGFDGNPSTILVDGYEGLRDGRTVYVNAANAIISSNKLYTNIYLISYNQGADKTTIDIFNRILKNWKFNTNLPSIGECIDKDAAATGIKCLADYHCDEKEYCSSEKAKVVRDTKRLADLKDVDKLLEDYKKESGYYPNMNVGSYLPNVTISVWPSWLDSFSGELGESLSVDPLNKMSDCGDPKYNKITCWDDENKEFAGTYTPAVGAGVLPTLSLPSVAPGVDNSRVYLYRVSKDASNFALCSVFESVFLIADPKNCF